MHEYSLVQSLLARVEAEARSRQAMAVHRVVVRIGELAGVDPDLFATAYDCFRAGTACERAALELERVPTRWSCPRCLREIPRGEVLACGVCQSPAEVGPGSDEIMLVRLEMEVR